MSKTNSNPSPNNPNPSLAMNYEDRVEVSAARILKVHHSYDGFLQNQLLSFAGGPDESFQSLNSSTEVQRRVIALRETQNKHDEFEVEYNEKATLDAKYQNIYYPLYEQRFKIVSGAVEGEGNDGTQNMGVGRDEDKGIPSFWLRCGARFITVVTSLRFLAGWLGFD